MSIFANDKWVICVAVGSFVSCMTTIFSLVEQSCNVKTIVSGAVGCIGAGLACVAYLGESVVAREMIVKFSAVASSLIAAAAFSLYVVSTHELYECFRNVSVNHSSIVDSGDIVADYKHCMILQGLAITCLVGAGVVSCVGSINRLRERFGRGI